jgi:hypothetical protein
VESKKTGLKSVSKVKSVLLARTKLRRKYVVKKIMKSGEDYEVSLTELDELKWMKKHMNFTQSNTLS